MENIDSKLSGHNQDYNPSDAWKQYTKEELEWWVRLLQKRASMRVEGAKKDKDIRDANNYQEMLDAMIKEGN